MSRESNEDWFLVSLRGACGEGGSAIALILFYSERLTEQEKKCASHNSVLQKAK